MACSVYPTKQNFVLAYLPLSRGMRRGSVKNQVKTKFCGIRNNSFPGCFPTSHFKLSFVKEALFFMAQAPFALFSPSTAFD